MANFAVSTRFTGKDLISKTFARMGKNADRFGNKSSKAFKKANRSASRFRDITKGILAAGAIQKVLGGLQRGVSAVTTEFISFDGAIISAAAKFKDVNLATAEGQKRLLELKKAARETGAATQFSAGQAASGLDFLAMAGFNATQAMAALPGVVNLATVANVDLGRATDIASDSLGAFGLMTEDATKLQKNFTRVNDVMALTMSRTNTNMEDMFEAIKKGAPAFTSSGQSLESFNALIGVMANSGVKGAEAGTQLRNVMLRLADPTKKAQEALDAMNIGTKDSKGNFRDVIDILRDFEKGLKGMGTQQRAAALSTIFGARAITGVNILLQEGTDQLAAFRGELVNAGGASQKMADIMRTSIGNRLKSLSSAAIEFGFKIFTAFEKRGAGAVDKLTEAIRNFDPQPIIEGLELTLTAVKFVSNWLAILVKGIQKVAAIAGAFAGGNIGVAFEGEKSEAEKSPGGAGPVAPNKEEAAAQRVAFKGQLNIAGAPAGSTVQGTTTGAPPIDMQMLGVNP